LRIPLIIILAALCASAADSSDTSGTQSDIARAAQIFVDLTRTRGMRPDSPITAEEHRGSKMLWHGRVYENFRNDILDAIPHEVTQNGEQNSVLRRNQFGLNVGGPLFVPKLLPNHNNTFFSLSYEGVRETISRAHLNTVPTLDERVGDFSHTVDLAGNLLPVYDPTTTRPNPSYDASQPVSTTNLQYLRDPFPGNRIPSERLDPVALQALTLYPAPNTAVGPFFQNNFFVNSPETNVADGFIGKVDHTFDDRHRITWDASISNGFLGSARYFPNAANPGSPDQKFQNRRSSLEYVFTSSPRTVNTASFSASSSTSAAQTPGGASSSFPRYDFSPYLSMGSSYPVSRNADNTYELSDGLSTRRGKHSLRFTATYDAYQVNSLVSAYPSGYFQFDSGLTSLPGITDTGFGFSSFLLGLTDSAERTIVTAPSYFRQSRAALALNDKYEAASNFTISIGINLSRHAPRVEKYNRQSTVDPAAIDPASGQPGALVFAGVNGVGEGLGPTVYRADPSAGITWNPFKNSKTVVRLGYSRSHAQRPIYNGQFGTQGFNARQTFVSANSQLTPSVILANGLPSPGPLPDLRPDAAVNTIADWIDLSGREPLYQSASLSIERELPFDLVLSGGAYYGGGRDLLIGDSSANPNAIPPSAMQYGNQLYDEAFRATLRPYPQYPGFELYGLFPGGRYQRESAFLRVEKRASFGLSFTAYYEFSKQFDDYSGPYGIQDMFNRSNDWSLTASNPQQYAQLGYTYELPFGANKPLLNFSDWRRQVVDGWSLSGTAYWNDGTPLAVHPEFNNTGGVISALNVNTVPGVSPSVSNQGPALWFNPAAFEQPPDFTLGDASRTSSTLRNPGVQSMDLSVNKRLPMGADRALDLSASAFNVLNHADWNTPDTTIGPSSAPNLDAGHIIGSHGGRVIQVGMKFSF
jgi:hypothetical protein